MSNENWFCRHAGEPKHESERRRIGRKCKRCRLGAHSWMCRGCNYKFCEHFVAFKKPDGSASCGRCQRRATKAHGKSS